MTIASSFTKSSWQVAKQVGADLWDRYVENAAPAQRHLDVTYVPLQREANGEKVDVGVFVPELYLIAKAGFLPAQLKAKQILGHDATVNNEDINKLFDEKKILYHALYRDDDDAVLKTPFELAIIHSNNPMRITAELMNTYQWLRKNGYEWPSYVSKARVVSDYLAHLEDIHLSVKESGSQSVYFTINNSPKWASNREKLMHFIAPWIASLVTMSAIISVIASYSLPVLFLYGIGTYLAYECANQFGIYDLAENLYREIGWLKSKEYRQGILSWRNALHAGLQFAGIGFACFLAAQGAWTGIAGAPLLQSTPYVGMILSGFFASIAALSTFIGLSGGIRYIRGLSIYDNQITFTQDEGKSLPIVTKESEKNIKRWSKETQLPEWLLPEVPQSNEKWMFEWQSSDSSSDSNDDSGCDSSTDYSELNTPTYTPSLNQASDRVFNRSESLCEEPQNSPKHKM